MNKSISIAIAAFLAGTIGLTGGCKGGASVDKQKMKNLAGKWVTSKKGRRYTTVIELELTARGRYTETTVAEIGGKRKTLYYNEYKAEFEIEPDDPEKIKELKKDRYFPMVEKGRYRIEIAKESGRIISFVRDDQGGSDDATGMGRRERRLEILSEHQIKMGPDTYNRE